MDISVLGMIFSARCSAQETRRDPYFRIAHSHMGSTRGGCNNAAGRMKLMVAFVHQTVNRGESVSIFNITLPLSGAKERDFWSNQPSMNLIISQFSL